MNNLSDNLDNITVDPSLALSDEEIELNLSFFSFKRKKKKKKPKKSEENTILNFFKFDTEPATHTSSSTQVTDQSIEEEEEFPLARRKRPRNQFSRISVHDAVHEQKRTQTHQWTEYLEGVNLNELTTWDSVPLWIREVYSQSNSEMASPHRICILGCCPDRNGKALLSYDLCKASEFLQRTIQITETIAPELFDDSDFISVDVRPIHAESSSTSPWSMCKLIRGAEAAVCQRIFHLWFQKFTPTKVVCFGQQAYECFSIGDEAPSYAQMIEKIVPTKVGDTWVTVIHHTTSMMVKGCILLKAAAFKLALLITQESANPERKHWAALLAAFDREYKVASLGKTTSLANTHVPIEATLHRKLAQLFSLHGIKFLDTPRFKPGELVELDRRSRRYRSAMSKKRIATTNSRHESTPGANDGFKTVMATKQARYESTPGANDGCTTISKKGAKKCTATKKARHESTPGANDGYTILNKKGTATKLTIYSDKALELLPAGHRWRTSVLTDPILAKRIIDSGGALSQLETEIKNSSLAISKKRNLALHYKYVPRPFLKGLSMEPGTRPEIVQRFLAHYQVDQEQFSKLTEDTKTMITLFFTKQKQNHKKKKTKAKATSKPKCSSSCQWCKLKFSHTGPLCYGCKDAAKAIENGHTPKVLIEFNMFMKKFLIGTAFRQRFAKRNNFYHAGPLKFRNPPPPPSKSQLNK